MHWGSNNIFSTIGLGDKAVFDRFFQLHRTENSHCNFTTRFIWRAAYDHQWAIIGDCLCVKGVWEGKPFVLAPLGPTPEAVGAALDKLEAYFRENDWPFLIKDIEPSVVEWLQTVRPDHYQFSEDRADYDYVYNTSDLIELPGRKYHAKRNHVGTFRRSYPGYEYRVLSDDLIQACIDYESLWYEAKAFKDETLAFEKTAIAEALTNFQPLRLPAGSF